MTKVSFLLLMMLAVLSACSVDRGGLRCPEGTAYRPGSQCVLSDGAVVDAFIDGDASSDDGNVPTDIGIDAGLLDADFGLVDSGTDSGLDSGPDPVDAGSDAGTDSGPDPVDAGMRRCEDTTMGICVRVDGVPLIADWVAQFNWTVPGGSVYTIDWMANRCIGGIRVIDADTTECEIAIPDPGTPVIDTGIAYIYPTRSDGISACTTSTCPGFFAAYRLWIRGIEYPTDPATPGGRVSLDNRPALDGMHRVVHINLP